jgi:hypothetical protein
MNDYEKVEQYSKESSLFQTLPGNPDELNTPHF